MVIGVAVGAAIGVTFSTLRQNKDKDNDNSDFKYKDQSQ